MTMQVLDDQGFKTNATIYICLAVSIFFAIPVSSEVMNCILRIVGVIIILTAYINFIINEKPRTRIIVSASIPAFFWSLFEFLWHMWLIESGREAWKGGFLITTGGPAEVPVETFILLSLIIIQSYFVTGNKNYKKVGSYVAFSGIIFGSGSYLLNFFGITQSFFIMRGIPIDKLWIPLKLANVIAAPIIICIFLYSIFYLILAFAEKYITRG